MLRPSFCAALLFAYAPAAAQSRPDPALSVPVLASLVAKPASELADVIDRV